VGEDFLVVLIAGQSYVGSPIPAMTKSQHFLPNVTFVAIFFGKAQEHL
jgi:hypothetical protein